MPVAPRSRSRFHHRLLRWSVRLLVSWVAVTAALVGALRVVDPPTSAFMLARRVDAWRTHERGLTIRHTWVPLARISPHVQLAFIAAEDQKFPSHWGFDLDAIEDAVAGHLEGRTARGASTLTQQVAKNLFLWRGHSWLRKGLEAYFTVLLELLLPKHRILELHLNLAELGNGIYGVEAAARLYFGSSAANLEGPEAAILAAVLPNPRARRADAPSSQVQERATWIAEQVRHMPPQTLRSL